MVTLFDLGLTLSSVISFIYKLAYERQHIGQLSARRTTSNEGRMEQ